MINKFDLYLANRIQEKGVMDLQQLAEKFQRSPLTIRRSIANLNEHLPAEQQFLLSDALVTNQISYRDLVAMIQSLEIIDYSANLEERFQYMISEAALHKVFNISQLYDELLVSQSTKKKDRPLLAELLAEKGLAFHTIRGKGVSITGDPCAFRILAATILLKVTHISANGQIQARQANNPIQQGIYEKFAAAFDSFQTDPIEAFLTNNQIQLNYLSKKFLILYLFLASYQIDGGDGITELPQMSVPFRSFCFFDQPAEDAFLSALLASLDNNNDSLYVPSPDTDQLCTALIDYVEERILTTFYTKGILTKEIGRYLHKCLLRKELAFDFYDNKLEDVQKEFSFLFQVISYYFEINEATAPKLSLYQLSTITLIFRNHVLQNKVAGRNRKKIVVVTNSAEEKSAFFSQQLLYHFDVEVIKEINIHEIHRLKQLDFDNLITFSNRISTILQENGYGNIKMNYYFHSKDIDLLTKLGFSLNSHRKLLAKEFVANLKKVPDDKLIDFLVNDYPNFFV